MIKHMKREKGRKSKMLKVEICVEDGSEDEDEERRLKEKEWDENKEDENKKNGDKIKKLEEKWREEK